MKKFIFILCALLICSVSHAQTETMNWYVDGNVYDTTQCESGGDVILPTAPTKRGYTFEGWGAKYTRVEYLESTGTQWIDTGYIPNLDTRINATYNMIYSSSTTPIVFGVSNGARLPQFSLYIWDNMYYYTFGRKKTDSDNDIKITTTLYNYIHTIDCNKNVFTLDNITVTGSSDSDVSIEYPLYIFCRNIKNSLADNCSTMKLYGFKIWNNDILVRDFIPVLDPYDVPCMFDKVSGMFFYNSGTGDFIAGPVLLDEGD